MPEQPFTHRPDGAPSPGAASPDHRRSTERVLLGALREGDHLALAEVWQRTAPAAHAVARRLLGPGEDLQGILRRLYAELWRQPPSQQPIERWIRSRCFALGVEVLRAEGRTPAVPSLAALLPELPAPAAATDPVERILAALPPAARLALVRAHDQGVPTGLQPDPQAATALAQALTALAEQPATAGLDATGDAKALGDLALGLLDSEQAQALQARLLDLPDLSEQLRLLRRGRRRVEGLPPTPELGPRVLLGVVAGEGPPEPPGDAWAAAWHEAEADTQGPALSPVAGGGRGDDEHVVITVARQSPGDAATRRRERAVPPHEQDTGPIAVIAAPHGGTRDEPPAVWDQDMDRGAFPAPDGEPEHPAAAPAATSGVDAAAAEEPFEGPGVRRGIGLLLVGTALGMLAGALTLVLR